MDRRPFQFQQFQVYDDQCAMKVGTDGVLLAAWCRMDEAETLLDVGTGSGVIALILAQRSPNTHITGLEIEPQACRQAMENFKTSPWQDRLHAVEMSLQDYSGSCDLRFDHIVSNPPFFSDSQFSKPHGSNRHTARNDILLPLADLMKCSKDLLSDRGRISLILPEASFETVSGIASGLDLYLTRRTAVRSMEGKSPHRTLLEFSRKFETLSEDELILQKSLKRNDFSDSYMNLVRELYTTL